MAEACSVRDDLKAFEALNAKVYGISVDSPFAQEAMALKEELNFPLLSDFNKSVSSDYGVLYEDFIGFEGVSKRSAFVVSKEGKVIFSWSSDDPKQLLILIKLNKLFNFNFLKPFFILKIIDDLGSWT